MNKIRSFAAACAAACLVASAQADTISLSAASGGWVATLTPTSAVIPCCSSNPINSAGLAWEAANVGWNSSTSYNASSWSNYSGGWIDAQGSTPFYARRLLTIDGTVTAASLFLQVDDDAQLWVNGTLVYDDHNGGTDGGATTNIASFLHSGDNVIAFKAHNSNGGGYFVVMDGSVTVEVPEPSSVALAGLALLGLAARRRRAA